MSDHFVTYDGKTVTEEQCIREHDRMLHHIIRRNYAGEHNSLIDPEDMLQELRICLLRVARNFDDSRGYKFSTYAYSSCSFAIRRYFRDFGYRTRVHAMTKGIVGKLRKRRETMAYEDMLEKKETFAEEYDVPILCVEEAARIVFFGETVSFDADVPKKKSAEPDMTFKETLVCHRADEAFDEAVCWSLFKQAMTQLEPRERYAMTAFVNGKLKKEIAEDLHVSGRTASNLISRSLSKLQHAVS